MHFCVSNECANTCALKKNVNIARHKCLAMQLSRYAIAMICNCRTMQLSQYAFVAKQNFAKLH